jgi:dihydroorotate dehydrogenase (fumarate)
MRSGDRLAVPGQHIGHFLETRMDLSTNYLGFKLAHPLMPGASPLADDLDTVRQLEDAGASAIVLRSLFEEQISNEHNGLEHNVRAHTHAFAEAMSYLPDPDDFVFGPDRYLEHVSRVKAATRLPVIGSLNGTTPEGWLSYAHEIQQAGADALELNFYHVATDTNESGTELEHRLLEVVRAIKKQVTIPVALKLSPFFSSLPHLAKELQTAGADGLVLFNRFYQPDIDPEALETLPRLHLSTSNDLLLRVRWLAILSGRLSLSLGATGGVHTGLDALKAVMAGAHGVQVVAALLQNGPGYLAIIVRDLVRWLEQHEYDSLSQAQGSMNLMRSPDPGAFERGNYMKVLQTWRTTGVGA